MTLMKLSLTLVAVVATSVSAGAQSAGTARVAHSSINVNIGNLPLTFEANSGQTDPRVKFVSRAPGYTAFLTSDGLVLSLRAKCAATGNATDRQSKATVEFRLLGASSHPSIRGELPQPGKV